MGPWVLALIACAPTTVVGPGAHGVQLASTGADVVPWVRVVTGIEGPAEAGDVELIATGPGIRAGDVVLVHVPVSEDPEEAGRFDRVVVARAEGARLTLGSPLDRAVPAGAQLVRIHVADVLAIDGVVRAEPWDGRIGGVLALEVRHLTVHGSLSADGAGLRGGRAPGTRHAMGCRGPDDPRSAERGEGLDGELGRTGFGAPSTGGGGGNCHNAGGGGGGNGGIGGQGGFSWVNETNPKGDVGGRGGRTAPQGGLGFGGGGGAGQSDGPEAPGGRGGGAIWLRGARLDGVGTVVARGQPGQAPPREGGGGGGAGGTVWLEVEEVTAVVDASGGAGASTLEEALGPGGGGAGGVVVGAEARVDGGPGGVDPRGDAYGATAGSTGRSGR